MEVIQVLPRDFYLHYIYVTAKEFTIRWTFATRKNGIAFGLYRRLGYDSLPSSSDIAAKELLKQKGNYKCTAMYIHN